MKQATYDPDDLRVSKKSMTKRKSTQNFMSQNRLTKDQINYLREYYREDPDWSKSTQLKAVTKLDIRLKKVYKWGVDQKRKYRMKLLVQHSNDLDILQPKFPPIVDFNKAVNDVIMMV